MIIYCFLGLVIKCLFTNPQSFPRCFQLNFSGITAFVFNKKHKSHFCSDVSFCKEGKEKSKVLWEDLTFKGILQDLKLPSDICLCKNYKTF